MPDIKKRELKMQANRKTTTFRDFLKTIASNVPLVLYKDQWFVSRYPKTDRVNVIGISEYEEARASFTQHGLAYDFDSSFFQNYAKLTQQTPFPARMIDPGSENSDFAEAVRRSKNIYLSHIVIHECENILYTFYTQDRVRNVLNSVLVRDGCDNVYQSSGVIRWFNIFYSRYIVNCSNVWFSSNLMGCQECLFCDNLENQSYCIDNKPVDKAVYLAKKKEILSDPAKFFAYYMQVNLVSKNFNSHNIKGQFCIDSNNVENGYFWYRVQDARNIFFVGHKEGRHNVLDTFCSDEVGYGDMFGCVNIGRANNVYLCDCIVWQSLYYCFNCWECSYCLGCSWLKNKSFCILNKEYSKEDWYVLANKIFAQMESDWILWAYFPASTNPLYFNDTAAYLIDDSFTKEEVTKEWYLRRDEEINVDIAPNADVITTQDLAQYQWFDSVEKRQIDPEIMKKVIKDEKWNYYKIVPMELDFLMKHGLPLPALHWLDRIKLWFKFK